ncbi:MAG: hypothetical protein L0Y66_15570 [Myxococcaceae bacterium]|nr:hypothetical protein [Myxococcaceae bacterium]MCI0671964.1 hypothetical protein [Myxococcaceae bacterium]
MARARLAVAAALLLGVVSACEGTPRAQSKRAELRRLGGDRVEIVPAKDQLPYCLAFTRSSTGVLRQLTMTHENKSVRCNAGEPMGNVSYRIPVEEGDVSLYVFLSDQKLNAGSVSQQLYEMPTNQRFTPINLRLPGQVFVETLSFAPEKDSEVAVGAVVKPGGQLETQVPAAPAQQSWAAPAPADAEAAKGAVSSGAVR